MVHIVIYGTHNTIVIELFSIHWASKVVLFNFEAFVKMK